MNLQLALLVPGVCARGVSTSMWAEALEPWMESSGINTPKRIAAFLGNVSVESGGFATLSENLNYQAKSLLMVWPSHFDSELAKVCAYKPELIANIVYCDRMGNGDTASGDGWTYRGAGLIQLTGKSNQSRFAQAVRIPVDQVGDFLRTPKGAAQSACWFWTDRKLNTMADAWMLTASAKAINGGTNGLEQRINLCNAILKALS